MENSGSVGSKLTFFRADIMSIIDVTLRTRNAVSKIKNSEVGNDAENILLKWRWKKGKYLTMESFKWENDLKYVQV